MNPDLSPRPWFLGRTYRPTHDQNRMRNEGNVPTARKLFLEGRNKNLVFLLDQRFRWMQRHIDPAAHDANHHAITPASARR